MVDPNSAYNRRVLQLPARAWNAGLLVAAMAMDVGAGISLLAIPLLAISLGASPLLLGLIGVVWRLPYALFCPMAGGLSDRIGRKRMVQSAATTLALCYILLSRTSNLVELFVLVPFLGLATGLFWPPLQSWIGDLRTGALGSAVGKFNIAWSSASFFGTVAAGFLSEVDIRTPFIYSTGLVVLIAIITMLVPVRPQVVAGSNLTTQPDATTVHSSPSTLHRTFLHAAWIANLVTFVGSGTITTFFPKLGSDLGLSPRLIGVVIGAFALGRLLTFIALAASTQWQYNVRLLTVVPFAGASIMALAAASNSAWLLILCFAVVGVVAAITYTSSLFYSLNSPVKTGAAAGMHESLLSTGLTLSALLGGIVAQTWGLRAPFVLSSIILGCGAVLVTQRLRRIPTLSA